MARSARAGRAEHERSAGGVVTRGGEVLLIAMRRGRWQLPKGHVEPGETAAEAAVREVREETGVVGRPVAELPSIDYWFVAGGRRIHKTVDYFLLDYVSGSAADYDPSEVAGAAWFGWEEARERLSFPNERRVAEAAFEARAAAPERRGRAR